MNVSTHFTGSSLLIEHDSPSPTNSRPDSWPHGAAGGGGASGGAGGGQPYRSLKSPKHSEPTHTHGVHVPSVRSTFLERQIAMVPPLTPSWLSHLLSSALVRVAHCPMLAHGAGAAGGGASEIVNVAFMELCSRHRYS